MIEKKTISKKVESDRGRSMQVDAVLEAPKTVVLEDGEELTLRPFTFGSLTLAHKLGLTLFTGEGDDLAKEDGDAGVDNELMRQLQTFLWMQSQPVDDVLHAVQKNEWKDRVLAFSFKLPLHEASSLFAEVNRISTLAAESAVDVIPKDAPGDDDTPGE